MLNVMNDIAQLKALRPACKPLLLNQFKVVSKK